MALGGKPDFRPWKRMIPNLNLLTAHLCFLYYFMIIRNHYNKMMIS